MNQRQDLNINGSNNSVNQTIKNVFNNDISMDFFALEKTINKMLGFIETNPDLQTIDDSNIEFFNQTRESIEIKNMINNLPKDYFESIKKYLPDFEIWRQAIFAPENDECAKKYKIIVDTLNPIIKTMPTFADAISGLMSKLHSYLERREEEISDNCREKMLLVIYFMYYFCDIGVESNATSDSN